MTSQYIVIFEESATTEHIDDYVREIEEHGGSITHRFPDMIARGFSATIEDSDVLRLQQDPRIERITPDGSTNAQPSLSFFGLAA